MKHASFAALAFLSMSVNAHATSAMDVADPRPAHHVVDLTGTLSAADIAAIDASAASAASNGELLVVVVQSTDGANPRQWTTALFNRLRLDTRERNRGVLLTAALGDRKSEIVVGEGFPGDVTGTTDSIMQGTVVARFKSGDPKRAMVEGAAAIAARVIGEAAPAPAIAPTKPVATEPVAPSPELLAAVAAASSSKLVKGLVDPRPKSVVVDRAAALRKSDVAAINAERARMAGEIEPLFLVVKNTARIPSRPFALAAFERLGLGAAAEKRGVLVLAVVADRTFEVVTGEGFPAHALPLLEAFAADLEGRKEPVSATLKLAAHALVALGPAIEAQGATLAAEAEEKARVDAAKAAAWADRVRSAQAAETNADQFDIETENPLLYVGGAAGLGMGGLGVREVLRRRPRSCKSCKIRMHRLAEDDDDKHLKDGERAEERLGSVDYDIWACGSCGSVLKTRWGALFSSYSRCKSCSWRTMSSTSRTIRSATTSSTGLAEVTETCSHCSYRNSYQRTIPRVQKSSSSSSGRSGGGGGGGGFSSGRGSSGSW